MTQKQKVLEKHPDAVVQMNDAGWIHIVVSIGKFLDSIGHGRTEDGAWQNAATNIKESEKV